MLLRASGRPSGHQEGHHLHFLTFLRRENRRSSIRKSLRMSGQDTIAVSIYVPAWDSENPQIRKPGKLGSWKPGKLES